MVPRAIRTYPFSDDNDQKQWKVEDGTCSHTCIQGVKDSLTPEVCPWYQNLNGRELCHVSECDECS